MSRFLGGPHHAVFLSHSGLPKPVDIETQHSLPTLSGTEAAYHFVQVTASFTAG